MIAIGNPTEEQKEYLVLGKSSAMGKSTIDILCPYCSAITTAYLWSLAGSGKKCECGAKHTHRYGTIKKLNAG